MISPITRRLTWLSPYRVLELTMVYRLAQFVIAPGFERPFVDEMKAVAATLPAGQQVLDVGCGPQSWLPRLGIHPIGLDLLPAYTAALRASGLEAVTGSATALPFRDHTLDGVWCLAVLHHLSDDQARTALREMRRVCRPGGYVVVWEIVLPERALRRPVAWAARKLDRGGRVRSVADFRALFDEISAWKFHAFRYTIYGLEGFFCVLRLETNE